MWEERRKIITFSDISLQPCDTILVLRSGTMMCYFFVALLLNTLHRYLSDLIDEYQILMQIQTTFPFIIDTNSIEYLRFSLFIAHSFSPFLIHSHNWSNDKIAVDSSHPQWWFKRHVGTEYGEWIAFDCLNCMTTREKKGRKRYKCIEWNDIEHLMNNSHKTKTWESLSVIRPTNERDNQRNVCAHDAQPFMCPSDYVYNWRRKRERKYCFSFVFFLSQMKRITKRKTGIS